VSAPDELRETFDRLSALAKVRKAAALRPGPTLGTVEAATKLALKKLARRYLALVDEIAELDAHLEPLVRASAPALVAQLGIGVQSPRSCWSPPATTPSGCVRRDRSRTCAAWHRCPPPRASASIGIGSTRAATATRTQVLRQLGLLVFRAEWS
jgi:hypothetical protein